MTTSVLIVDDAAAVRRALVYALGIHPDIEVAGTAVDGRDAITAIEVRNPDVVLLDLMMPVLDGIGALEIIRRRWPALPVVVFSTASTRGSLAATQALVAGAVAALPKPMAATPDEVVALVHGEIVPLLLAVSRRDRPAAETVTPELRAPQSTGRPDLLVIGASTGGPFALAQLLADLGRVDIPVMVTQHMPIGFTEPLARHLSMRTGLDVAEAFDGAPLRSGSVRIAPGGRHLLVAGGRDGLVTRLTDTAPVHHCRPAVDPLFMSAARVVGSAVLGVVLTGMGSDGADGAGHIVTAGGEVLAQDAATSVVWGMPGAVATAGHASEILPIEELGSAVRRRIVRTPAPAAS
ncbi:MAG: chemotaxis-specific protein-glutamate methyltransferase CheB [Acidimicrobiales bacterium]